MPVDPEHDRFDSTAYLGLHCYGPIMPVTGLMMLMPLMVVADRWSSNAVCRLLQLAVPGNLLTDFLQVTIDRYPADPTDTGYLCSREIFREELKDLLKFSLRQVSAL